MFLKRCPPTLGGLFAFAASSKRSERNFLRENMLLLRGQQTAPNRMERPRNPPLRAHNYELPTAASLARRHGSSAQALAEVQRRLMTLPPGRKRSVYNRKASSSSEKQIQTEDTWFLNRSQAEPTPMSRHSEGDESVRPLAQAVQSHGQLRRSASNFELGKITEQRGNYQPGQYVLHRPLGDVAAFVPGEVDTVDNAEMQKQQQQKQRKPLVVMNKRSKVKKAAPQVMEVSIPEIIDANVEPEDLPSDRSLDTPKKNLDLDLPLSSHSSSSSPPPESEREPALHLQPNQVEAQPILLSDSQRVALIELAQTRQSQLIAEYNRLPISMGTLRVRNLKRQLEQQLDTVESDLSVLTQPKVYMRQLESNQSHSIS